MAQTLEQKIAALDAKIARLRHQKRKLETGQKIILGGMLLNAARRDQYIREWLLKEAAKTVTRDIDKNRLTLLLEELSNMNTKSKHQ